MIVKVFLSGSGYRHFVPVPRTEVLSPEITDNILSRGEGAPGCRYQVCLSGLCRATDPVQAQAAADGEDIDGW